MVSELYLVSQEIKTPQFYFPSKLELPSYFTGELRLPNPNLMVNEDFHQKIKTPPVLIHW